MTQIIEQMVRNIVKTTHPEVEVTRIGSLYQTTSRYNHGPGQAKTKFPGNYLVQYVDKEAKENITKWMRYNELSFFKMWFVKRPGPVHKYLTIHADDVYEYLLTKLK